MHQRAGPYLLLCLSLCSQLAAAAKLRSGQGARPTLGAYTQATLAPTAPQLPAAGRRLAAQRERAHASGCAWWPGRRAARGRGRTPGEQASQLPQQDDFFTASLVGSVTTILVPSPGRGALSSAASAFLLTMW